jgi:hypothetical protein
MSERLNQCTDGGIGFGCGVSTYPDEGATVRELIAHADAQLYEEKQVHRLERAQQVETRRPGKPLGTPPRRTRNFRPPPASKTA